MQDFFLLGLKLWCTNNEKKRLPWISLRILHKGLVLTVMYYRSREADHPHLGVFGSIHRRVKHLFHPVVAAHPHCVPSWLLETTCLKAKHAWPGRWFLDRPWYDAPVWGPRHLENKCEEPNRMHSTLWMERSRCARVSPACAHAGAHGGRQCVKLTNQNMPRHYYVV